ncbi:2-C-methyl-D-erythritol 4-phosphate cytidylyltransferase [Calderihabitans maritimus]|uniref:2-C-methyl-D-erythritol 4-phosphate cytidylyltransferase n=2 Tax=Calderihabitans maritimus TaxID=1246530 RepID=A0A1Z5HNX5_9FIRM|nr:2-C-methyl-D-erythritol 4-phosphate cytidylyltransferase [Calderihabitans maritimus]
MPSITAIIVAAGKGTRMQAEVPKQYLLLKDKPILARTLQVFDSSPLVNNIILVVSPGDEDYCRRKIIEPYNFQKVSKVIPGGLERQESVYNGLHALPNDCTYVVVHDGVRPFLTLSLLEQVIKAARELGAAVAAVPVKDTIKIAGPDGYVESTPERKRIWAVQTPQVFRRDLIVSAYKKAFTKGIVATDDSTLVEEAGFKVKLILGDYQNIKITTWEDFWLAETILERRQTCDRV